LRYGSYRHIYLDYQRPFIFERSYENERVFVAVNIADHDEVINLNAHCNGRLLDLLNQEHISTAHHITLRPHSARVLKEDVH